MHFLNATILSDTILKVDLTSLFIVKNTKIEKHLNRQFLGNLV